MLLLQEVNIDIRDKKGVENSVVDHLSWIERESDPMPIRDEFSDEQLLHINTPTPWFANICNFLPLEASRLYKEKLKTDAKYYIWDGPYLWRIYNDQVIRRRILDTKIKSIFQFCYVESGGDHYGSTRTARKVLDYEFYWPTIFRDTYQFVSTCKKCQRAGMAISKRHEMPQQPILFCEVFDVWGIYFMGPFPISNGYSYILLVVDYVSRWVEAIATKTNEAKVIVDFLKSNIFYRFGVPKALISDQGSHFCNSAIMGWCIELPQHTTPKQTTKLKYSTRKSRKHCKRWPIPTERTRGDSLRMPYGDTELHTKLHWECLPIGLFSFHDQLILRKEFRVSQKVLLFNSRLKLILGKLRSRWDGPFVITNVNGHQIKLFHEDPALTVGEMESISPMEPAPPDNSPSASLRTPSVFMTCIEDNASFNFDSV
ncbi:putative mitochondrial protein, partial [Mucuna pruriens]